MSRRWTVLVVLAAATLGGCAAMVRDQVSDRENTLAASGFTVLPASTPARQDMLARLPANHISQRIEGEHVSYLYPDPVVCHCLYVGSQEAFGRYQQIAQQKKLAADQLQAAQMNNEMGWEWGPWGGYGPGFY